MLTMSQLWGETEGRKGKWEKKVKPLFLGDMLMNDFSLLYFIYFFQESYIAWITRKKSFKKVYIF